MNPSASLAVLYARSLKQEAARNWKPYASVQREQEQALRRLEKCGVVTVADLIAELPRLPRGLQRSAIEFVGLLKIRRAIPVLIDLMDRPRLRLVVAQVLSYFHESRPITEALVEAGQRELAASAPDVTWLDAITIACLACDDRRIAEILLKTYERTDLPGWLRGNAADRLMSQTGIADRRTTLYRRCRAAALRGLDEEDLDVRFGSMYVIGALTSRGDWNPPTVHTDFHCALPRLRGIAATDHMLAPGYWWPLSAEAADVIGCIETGTWPQPDAAHRWEGFPERGEWRRD
ncbi:hypothetical protein [Planctellipticum variicoloris]|uniref:hypothetical protein n=1 Tax=Planctellipticum variicoloris TaxID=3064265 RepID=UPI0030132A92|nr:hypothetical protein SH412_000849 [Planctomycetaceae bacterium SH412]